MGTHRRDRELNPFLTVLVMVFLTLGVISFLLLIGALLTISVVYHFYWGIVCVPAGILIGVGVTWAVSKYGR